MKEIVYVYFCVSNVINSNLHAKIETRWDRELIAIHCRKQVLFIH